MAAALPNGGSKDSNKEGMDGIRSGEHNVAGKVNVNEESISQININTRISTTKDSKDAEKIKFRVQLEPGKVYQFRVAAANAAGRGPWSEVTTFKAPEPEPAILPAPTNIKLTSTKDGVKVSWDMPPNAKGVKEYCGFVSVKTDQSTNVNECFFMPVYTGTKTEFTISKEIIEMAAIDKSLGTPAILLRIVGKSDLEYGPATLVRCLNDCK